MKDLIINIILFVLAAGLFVFTLEHPAYAHQTHLPSGYSAGASLVKEYRTPHDTYFLFWDLGNDGSVDCVDEIVWNKHGYHIINILTPSRAFECVRDWEKNKPKLRPWKSVKYQTKGE